jgi:S-methylmethionine-dependent homocysteine/selenocysteine methylase
MDDPLVLDGGIEAELQRRGVTLRPHPGAAPLPVREPEAVRRLHLDVALAGANVVTAATGALHRRALARTGDARRAREWAHAALGLARDAAAEATDRGRDGGTDLRGERRPVRVAGLAAPLEGRAWAVADVDGTTAAQEHRAHASILAEGGAEIVRIQGMGTVRECEAATRAAVEEGLEAWSGVVVTAEGLQLLSGEPIEAWVEAVAPLRPAALLMEGPHLAAIRAGVGAVVSATIEWPGDAGGRAGPRIGAILPGRDREQQTGGLAVRLAVARLLHAGAALVGPGDDGSPDRVASIRSAVDRHTSRIRAAREGEDAAWQAWLEDGAGRAATGRALWLATDPPRLRLPAHLAWDIATPGDLASLPAGGYALVVALAVDPARLPGLLDRGGWLLVAADEHQAATLRRDDRLEWLAPTGTVPGRPADRLPGWIGRRRP